MRASDGTVTVTGNGADRAGQPVRFAVLGFGHHASKRLVPAFAASEETVLAGLWRRDRAQAARDVAEFGVRWNFATREELCGSAEVDAVFITSPDAMHLDDVRLAAAGGKAILCEKPLAMNEAEARTMEAAAAEAGVLLGVAQNMRWYESLRWVKETLAAGRLGRPQMARAQFCYKALETPRRWIADGSLACGGPIGDVGVHCLDALRWVLGQEIVSLGTVTRGGEGFGELEAVASMQGETDGGCLVEVAVSAMAPYRTQMEIVGSEGVLVLENGMAVDQPARMEWWRNGELVEQRTGNNRASYAAMLDSFARAMRGEEVFAASVADGVTNMRLLDAAYRGAKTGRVERLG